MKKVLMLASSIALATAAGFAFGGPANETQPAATFADLGPPASDSAGSAILSRIEAKWANVARMAYGWDDNALREFREGYRNYPLSVLEEALAAPTFERMRSVFGAYTALHARNAMAKAYPARQEFALNALAPDAAANVMEAKQLAAKVLGDDARDLVFIPISPCTVWDTRFAHGAPFGGAIGNGTTRQFYSHKNGAGVDFTFYGGNPSCAEANETFIGGRPFAVMMIVYVNNPAGNGWLTFYRDGDPDPSQATISVYYSPGPTRTQTVVSKSSRDYGTGLYDIAVTGRFSTTDASASVVGYFVKPQATALDCTSVDASATAAISTDSPVFYPSCPIGYTRTGGFCYGAQFHPTMWLLETGGNACVYRNTSAASTFDITAVSYCCRVPGR